MKVNPGTVVCVGSGDLGEGVCVGEFFVMRMAEPPLLLEEERENHASLSKVLAR